jgi:serine/threonine-protein kinase
VSDPNANYNDRWLGTTIAGRYRLVSVLGTGGHGAVYEAEHLWTRRRVALKMLRHDRLHVRGLGERFLREAQATTHVKHPNIVDVLDMGQDGEDGPLYLVEELLVGTDLRQLMRERGRFTPAEAIELALPVMDALDAAHTAGVVHRDVKPGNIFLIVGTEGRVVPKLIDFGTSRLLDDPGDHGHLTMTGEPMGTPAYMSPELARGKRAGPQTDVWAIGVMLYEMLSGERPFVASNYNALILAIATEEPVALRTLAPQVPEALAQVVHRALAKQLDVRFPSMRAMLEALHDTARSMPVTEVEDQTDEATDASQQIVSPPVATTVAALEPSLQTPAAPGVAAILRPRELTTYTPVASSPPEGATTPTSWALTSTHPRDVQGRRLIAASTAIAALLLLFAGGVALRRRTIETAPPLAARPVTRPPTVAPVPTPPVAPPAHVATLMVDAAVAATPALDTAEPTPPDEEPRDARHRSTRDERERRRNSRRVRGSAPVAAATPATPQPSAPTHDYVIP